MQIEPETLQLLAAASLAAAASGQKAEAETLFAAVEAAAEKDNNIAYLKGAMLAQCGRAAEAIEVLDGVLAASPSNVDAKFALAVAYHANGQVDARNRVAQEIIDGAGTPDSHVEAARSLMSA